MAQWNSTSIEFIFIPAQISTPSRGTRMPEFNLDVQPLLWYRIHQIIAVSEVEKA
jgi:hypothetical protein